MYRCLYANAAGEMLEHPTLSMMGRSGTEWVEPQQVEMIPLPNGSSLVAMPGRLPVGMDARGRAAVAAGPFNAPGEVTAVAALLPQGFTRTLYPACAAAADAPALPLLGYAAVGWHENGVYVAAVQTDAHRRWHPRYFNKEQLPRRVEAMRQLMPNNRIVAQLARCALEYGCFTAQNIFHRRWEGGIPVSSGCNAACIGCISKDHPQVAAPQQRIGFAASVDEVVELGRHHLQHGRDPIISFGQGCEGDPALQASMLAPAIRRIRRECKAGLINMNTNAGYTQGIMEVCDAGIDHLRVSMFSAREQYYNYYHRPRDYALDDVKRSLDYARGKGVSLALNLLLFPGFQDRPAETAALIELLREYEFAMLQLRNLNIDADLLFAGIEPEDEPAGVTTFLATVKAELPRLVIGSYTHSQAAT